MGLSSYFEDEEPEICFSRPGSDVRIVVLSFCSRVGGSTELHVSLYRRYRPQRFSEVVGQRAATDLLRLSFLEKRLSHAYLLSGPRGCGKTTVARLAAKAINCEALSPEGEPCCECASCRAVVAGEHLDVMEIDAASNRGIDQIRELKSHVSLAPFMGGRKIYILDEVHMLTTDAFNALLKTLEEPPPPVLFIFATTEPHKVPVTIRSRCVHVPFHRISAADIVGQLRFVAESEGFDADMPAFWEIARNADGALRDALTLTEQALAIGNGSLTMEAVTEFFGGGSRGELERWITLLRTDPAEAQALMKTALDRGASPERFLDSLFALLRDMWVYSLWGERSFPGVSLSDDEKKFLADETPHWTAERLRRACAVCAALFPRVRWGMGPDVFAGLLLLELLEGGEPLPAAPLRERAAVTAAVTPPEPAPAPLTLREERAPRLPAHEPAVPRETRAAPAPPEPVPDGLPPVFAALWRDDLALCAALLGVSVALTDGELVIDYGNAPRLARTALESPRARLALETAFGAARSHGGKEVNPADERDMSADAPEPARQGGGRGRKIKPSAMSLSELAAYLGGEILVDRPAELQDPEELTEHEQ